MVAHPSKSYPQFKGLINKEKEVIHQVIHIIHINAPPLSNV